MKELIYNKAIKDKLMDLYIQNLKKSVDITDKNYGIKTYANFY